MIHTNEYASKLLFEASKQTERLILDQLNDFISRGLIEIEMGPMTLVNSQISTQVEMRQTVQLRLKDREYIKKLEQDNEALRYEIKMLLNIKERESK
jgi:hypothetical protein